MPDNEKQFEQDIESFLISHAGGWQKVSDAGYRASMDSGLKKHTRNSIPRCLNPWRRTLIKPSFSTAFSNAL